MHESYCVPMMGTIQAFRVSLWITTSGRSDLWTTSSCLPVAEVYVPCRGCFVACAFLCVLSCARRAGGARGLLVACWGSAKKFALLGKNGRFSVFLGLLGEFFRGLAKMRPLLGEFFRAGRRMGARRANFVAR